VTPDEELLQGVVRALDACIERRIAAGRAGAMRVRLHAIDSELATLIEQVQRHCAVSGLSPPAGVPPLSAPGAHAATIAHSILSRFLGLLRSRRAVRDAALRVGDRATARAIDFAIRDDIETIRKHCERSGLHLPPEVMPAEDDH